MVNFPLLDIFKQTGNPLSKIKGLGQLETRGLMQELNNWVKALVLHKARLVDHYVHTNLRKLRLEISSGCAHVIL